MASATPAATSRPPCRRRAQEDREHVPDDRRQAGQRTSHGDSSGSSTRDEDRAKP